MLGLLNLHNIHDDISLTQSSPIHKLFGYSVSSCKYCSRWIFEQLDKSHYFGCFHYEHYFYRCPNSKIQEFNFVQLCQAQRERERERVHKQQDTEIFLVVRRWNKSLHWHGAISTTDKGGYSMQIVHKKKHLNMHLFFNWRLATQNPGAHILYYMLHARSNHISQGDLIYQKTDTECF